MLHSDVFVSLCVFMSVSVSVSVSVLVSVSVFVYVCVCVCVAQTPPRTYTRPPTFTLTHNKHTCVQ